MIFNENTAYETARKLLQIKAIKLQPSAPFVWASGWKSPIYCDNRITLSYPSIRSFLRDRLAEGVKEKYPVANCIAGVATGAIAIGVLVAEKLGIPFVYVRPEAKSHGRKNQIEGELPENSKVVVIEDLVSTGGSSLKAVEALHQTDAKVLGMMALFTYDFPVSRENFEKARCELTTLSDYPHLLQEANRSGAINEDTLNILKTWRENPGKWQAPQPS